MADKVRLSDKKYKEVFNFVDKYVNKDAAKAFDKAYKEGREIEWLNKFWPKLEGYSAWTNTYSSIEDLTASPDKQMEQIYNKNPDYDKISDARMKSILDNNDVTEEQLKSYYAYRKAASEAVSKINEDRYKDLSSDYEQINRSKDDSYYNSPLANEYAREAYIKGNPQMAAYHEAVGKVAGASDFAPFPLSLLGPGLRTVQKAYADKDIITPGTMADFAGAVIPDFAEKPAKFIYDFAKGGIEKYLPRVGESKIMKAIEARVNKADADKVQDLAKTDLEVMKSKLDDLTDKELLELYNKANNPKLKAGIEEYFKSRGDLYQANMIKESITERANATAKELANNGFGEIVSKDDALNYLRTHAKDFSNKPLDDATNKVVDEYIMNNLKDVSSKESDKVVDYYLQLRARDMANKQLDMAKKSLHDKDFDYTKTVIKEQPTTELKAGISKAGPFDGNHLNPYYKNTPLSTISEYEASKVTPNKGASTLYNIMTYGGRKAARTGLSGRLGQWNTFNPEPADKSEQLIKDTISMYSNKWSPIELPAEYHTNPLIRDAYDKWYNDIANRPFYEAEWRNK